MPPLATTLPVVVEWLLSNSLNIIHSGDVRQSIRSLFLKDEVSKQIQGFAKSTEPSHVIICFRPSKEHGGDRASCPRPGLIDVYSSSLKTTKAIFFIKRAPQQYLDEEENIQREELFSLDLFSFGEIHGSVLDAYETVLRDVFLPLLTARATEEWGSTRISQRKDFLKLLSTFSDFLVDLRQSTAHGAVLSAPDTVVHMLEDAQRTQQSISDAEVMRHTENLCRRWCDEVEAVLRAQSPSDYGCANTSSPHAELTYWRVRVAHLTALAQQLRKREYRVAGNLIARVKPRSAKRWKNLENNIPSALVAAKENCKSVTSLEHHLLRLSDADMSLEELQAKFSPFFNSLRTLITTTRLLPVARIAALVVTVAEHISNRAVGFIEETLRASDEERVTLAILAKVRPTAEYNLILDDLSRASSTLEMFTRQYRLMQDQLVAHKSRSSMELNNIDAVIQLSRRLEAIVDVILTVRQYVELAPTGKWQLQLAVETVGMSDELLACHMSKFDMVIESFKDSLDDLRSSLVDDLDRRFRALVSTDSLSTDYMASLRLLTELDRTVHTEEIVKDVHGKLVSLATKFGTVIEFTLQCFEQDKRNPPVVTDAPPLAGRVVWVRKLIDRIESLMTIFGRNETLVASPECRRIITRYNVAMRSLTEYETILHQAWFDAASKITRDALETPLLTISEPEDADDASTLRRPRVSVLSVAVPISVMVQIAESNTMKRLGLEVPPTLDSIAQCETRLLILRQTMDETVRAYEESMQGVTPVLFPFVEAVMRPVVDALMPGVTGLVRWASSNTDAFFTRVDAKLEAAAHSIAVVRDIIAEEVRPVLLEAGSTPLDLSVSQDVSKAKIRLDQILDKLETTLMAADADPDTIADLVEVIEYKFASQIRDAMLAAVESFTRSLRSVNVPEPPVADEDAVETDATFHKHTTAISGFTAALTKFKPAGPVACNVGVMLSLDSVHQRPTLEDAASVFVSRLVSRIVELCPHLSMPMVDLLAEEEKPETSWTTMPRETDENSDTASSIYFSDELEDTPPVILRDPELYDALARLWSGLVDYSPDVCRVIDGTRMFNVLKLPPTSEIENVAFVERKISQIVALDTLASEVPVIVQIGPVAVDLGPVMSAFKAERKTMLDILSRQTRDSLLGQLSDLNMQAAHTLDALAVEPDNLETLQTVTTVVNQAMGLATDFKAFSEVASSTLSFLQAVGVPLSPTELGLEQTCADMSSKIAVAYEQCRTSIAKSRTAFQLQLGERVRSTVVDWIQLKNDIDSTGPGPTFARELTKAAGQGGEGLFAEAHPETWAALCAADARCCSFIVGLEARLPIAETLNSSEDGFGLAVTDFTDMDEVLAELKAAKACIDLFFETFKTLNAIYKKPWNTADMSPCSTLKAKAAKLPVRLLRASPIFQSLHAILTRHTDVIAPHIAMMVDAGVTGTHWIALGNTIGVLLPTVDTTTVADVCRIEALPGAEEAILATVQAAETEMTLRTGVRSVAERWDAETLTVSQRDVGGRALLAVDDESLARMLAMMATDITDLANIAVSDSSVLDRALVTDLTHAHTLLSMIQSPHSRFIQQISLYHRISNDLEYLRPISKIDSEILEHPALPWSAFPSTAAKDVLAAYGSIVDLIVSISQLHHRSAPTGLLFALTERWQQLSAQFAEENLAHFISRATFAVPQLAGLSYDAVVELLIQPCTLWPASTVARIIPHATGLTVRDGAIVAVQTDTIPLPLPSPIVVPDNTTAMVWLPLLFDGVRSALQIHRVCAVAAFSQLSVPAEALRYCLSLKLAPAAVLLGLLTVYDNAIPKLVQERADRPLPTPTAIAQSSAVGSPRSSASTLGLGLASMQKKSRRPSVAGERASTRGSVRGSIVAPPPVFEKSPAFAQLLTVAEDCLPYRQLVGIIRSNNREVDRVMFSLINGKLTEQEAIALGAQCIISASAEVLVNGESFTTVGGVQEDIIESVESAVDAIKAKPVPLRSEALQFGQLPTLVRELCALASPESPTVSEIRARRRAYTWLIKPVVRIRLCEFVPGFSIGSKLRAMAPDTLDAALHLANSHLCQMPPLTSVIFTHQVPEAALTLLGVDPLVDPTPETMLAALTAGHPLVAVYSPGTCPSDVMCHAYHAMEVPRAIDHTTESTLEAASSTRAIALPTVLLPDDRADMGVTPYYTPESPYIARAMIIGPCTKLHGLLLQKATVLDLTAPERAIQVVSRMFGADQLDETSKPDAALAKVLAHADLFLLALNKSQEYVLSIDVIRMVVYATSDVAGALGLDATILIDLCMDAVSQCTSQPEMKAVLAYTLATLISGRHADAVLAMECIETAVGVQVPDYAAATAEVVEGAKTPGGGVIHPAVVEIMRKAAADNAADATLRQWLLVACKAKQVTLVASRDATSCIQKHLDAIGITKTPVAVGMNSPAPPDAAVVIRIAAVIPKLPPAFPGCILSDSAPDSATLPLDSAHPAARHAKGVELAISRSMDAKAAANCLLHWATAHGMVTPADLTAFITTHDLEVGLSAAGAPFLPIHADPTLQRAPFMLGAADVDEVGLVPVTKPVLGMPPPIVPALAVPVLRALHAYLLEGRDDVSLLVADGVSPAFIRLVLSLTGVISDSGTAVYAANTVSRIKIVTCDSTDSVERIKMALESVPSNEVKYGRRDRLLVISSVTQGSRFVPFTLPGDVEDGAPYTVDGRLERTTPTVALFAAMVATRPDFEKVLAQAQPVAHGKHAPPPPTEFSYEDALLFSGSLFDKITGNSTLPAVSQLSPRAPARMRRDESDKLLARTQSQVSVDAQLRHFVTYAYTFGLAEPDTPYPVICANAAAATVPSSQLDHILAVLDADPVPVTPRGGNLWPSISFDRLMSKMRARIALWEPFTVTGPPRSGRHTLLSQVAVEFDLDIVAPTSIGHFAETVREAVLSDTRVLVVVDTPSPNPTLLTGFGLCGILSANDFALVSEHVSAQTTHDVEAALLRAALVVTVGVAPGLESRTLAVRPPTTEEFIAGAVLKHRIDSTDSRTLVRVADRVLYLNKTPLDAEIVSDLCHTFLRLQGELEAIDLHNRAVAEQTLASFQAAELAAEGKLDELNTARIRTDRLVADLHATIERLTVASANVEELKVSLAEARLTAQRQETTLLIAQTALKDRLDARAGPMLAAREAINSLDPDALVAIRGMRNPPSLVRRVVDCLMILLRRPLKPVGTVDVTLRCIEDGIDFGRRVREGDVVTVIESATDVSQLTDADFVHSLTRINPDEMTDEDHELLQPYLEARDFTWTHASRSFLSLASVVEFLHAMAKYHAETVEAAPLTAELAQLTREHDAAEAELSGCEAKLSEAESQATALRGELSRVAAEKVASEEERARLTKLTTSAGRLTTDLASIRASWEQTLKAVRATSDIRGTRTALAAVTVNLPSQLVAVTAGEIGLILEGLCVPHTAPPYATDAVKGSFVAKSVREQLGPFSAFIEPLLSMRLPIADLEGTNGRDVAHLTLMKLDTLGIPPTADALIPAMAVLHGTKTPLLVDPCATVAGPMMGLFGATLVDEAAFLAGAVPDGPVVVQITDAVPEVALEDRQVIYLAAEDPVPVNHVQTIQVDYFRSSLPTIITDRMLYIKSPEIHRRCHKIRCDLLAEHAASSRLDVETIKVVCENTNGAFSTSQAAVDSLAQLRQATFDVEGRLTELNAQLATASRESAHIASISAMCASLVSASHDIGATVSLDDLVLIMRAAGSPVVNLIHLVFYQLAPEERFVWCVMAGLSHAKTTGGIGEDEAVVIVEAIRILRAAEPTKPSGLSSPPFLSEPVLHILKQLRPFAELVAASTDQTLGKLWTTWLSSPTPETTPIPPPGTALSPWMRMLLIILTRPDRALHATLAIIANHGPCPVDPMLLMASGQPTSTERIPNCTGFGNCLQILDPRYSALFVVPNEPLDPEQTFAHAISLLSISHTAPLLLCPSDVYHGLRIGVDAVLEQAMGVGRCIVLIMTSKCVDLAQRGLLPWLSVLTPDYDTKRATTTKLAVIADESLLEPVTAIIRRRVEVYRDHWPRCPATALCSVAATTNPTSFVFDETNLFVHALYTRALFSAALTLTTRTCACFTIPFSPSNLAPLARWMASFVKLVDVQKLEADGSVESETYRYIIADAINRLTDAAAYGPAVQTTLMLILNGLALPEAIGDSVRETTIGAITLPRTLSRSSFVSAGSRVPVDGDLAFPAKHPLNHGSLMLRLTIDALEAGLGRLFGMTLQRPAPPAVAKPPPTDSFRGRLLDSIKVPDTGVVSTVDPFSLPMGMQNSQLAAQAQLMQLPDPHWDAVCARPIAGVEFVAQAHARYVRDLFAHAESDAIPLALLAAVPNGMSVARLLAAHSIGMPSHRIANVLGMPQATPLRSSTPVALVPTVAWDVFGAPASSTDVARAYLLWGGSEASPASLSDAEWHALDEKMGGSAADQAPTDKARRSRVERLAWRVVQLGPTYTVQLVDESSLHRGVGLGDFPDTVPSSRVIAYNAAKAVPLASESTLGIVDDEDSAIRHVCLKALIQMCISAGFHGVTTGTISKFVLGAMLSTTIGNPRHLEPLASGVAE
ncbi:Dynein heavy chain N-terminal region 1 [Carpediemonas membranifera]|uniref:Dynein heavy chain N-terminal region 1 n=1 Tax=Carpediemonas membranifera TaxID=201153 RepID=A0A8J6AWL4_9EUKA|nr:Dynein heavy chain N-terminal region 1 [Carpediemonas membranifera]|eukprot:KAG9393405.1 Dynein heavy chain N-terminal region 1 [Carpediemonas membranifera]